MRRFFPVTLLIAAAFLAAGCSRHRRAPLPPAPPPPPAPGWAESGIASWYGYPYHGRAAANGEIYDMEQLTAAHRTLPFNALVLVENRSNGKSVQVRITDRGPFVDGRIIDLSRAAAAAIDMIGPGTAPVRIRLLGYAAAPAPAPASARFAVQAGSFVDRDRAESLRFRLAATYAPVDVVEIPGDPPTFRVLVGDRPEREQAGALALQLRREFPDCFVVQRR